MMFLHQCLRILSNGQGKVVCRCNNGCRSLSTGSQISQTWVCRSPRLEVEEAGRDQVLGLGMQVPAWRHGTPGALLVNCPEAVGSPSGCPGAQGSHTG